MSSFNAFYHSLLTQISPESDLRHCLNDYERIKSLYNTNNLDQLQYADSFTGKSNIRSVHLRKLGNEFLSKKKWADCLEFYNRALFSADSLEEKSLCHGNKSMVLLELKYAKEALQEINSAIQCNFPRDKLVRLHIRAAECHLLLNNIDQSRHHLNVAEQSLNNVDGIKKPPRTVWLEKISLMRTKCSSHQPDETVSSRSLTFTRPSCESMSTRHPFIEAASGAVTLEETSTAGRGFFATRDIAIGEVLLVETPYVARLTQENFLTHCYTCMEPCFTLIPCRKCALVGFCSQHCVDVASLSTWPHSVSEPHCGLGHYWECSLLHFLYPPDNSTPPYLTDVTSLKMVQLAIATVSRTSPSTLLQVVKAAQEFSYQKLPQPFRSDDYSAAYSIVTNADKRTTKDLTARSILAILIMKFLKWCGYLRIEETAFDQFSEVWSETEKEILLASALLTHLQALPCNAHDVAQLIIDLESCPEPRELSCALYPCLSLINHSCDPNLMRISKRRGVCEVRSLAPIRAGEPLLDNYSCHYAVMPRVERRTLLERQYLFSCACSACCSDYPTYEELAQCSHHRLRYKCSECQFDFGDSTPGTCANCLVDLQSIWSELNTFRQSFPNHIADLVSPNQVNVDKCDVEMEGKRYLSLLHSVVQKPGGNEYHQAGETLKMLWNCQGNSLVDPFRDS